MAYRLQLMKLARLCAPRSECLVLLLRHQQVDLGPALNLHKRNLHSKQCLSKKSSAICGVEKLSLINLDCWATAGTSGQPKDINSQGSQLKSHQASAGCSVVPVVKAQWQNGMQFHGHVSPGDPCFRKNT